MKRIKLESELKEGNLLVLEESSRHKKTRIGYQDLKIASWIKKNTEPETPKKATFHYYPKKEKNLGTKLEYDMRIMGQLEGRGDCKKFQYTESITIHCEEEKDYSGLINELKDLDLNMVQ